MAAYKRIVLKLSGEALADKDKHGCYDAARVEGVADMLMRLAREGVELGVVIGGGNIWRGRFTDQMDPVNADQMGMLATVMNALCVSDALTRRGVQNAVFTAQQMDRFARLYTAAEARRCLETGGVALMAGGSGNPFFTTDTAAALRAAELRADAIFKGTTVEGVYDRDPRKFADAVLLKDISYKEAIDREIRVMDAAAFALCREQRIPAIRVFSMENLENILRVARGENLGSLVHN